ncbi:MAG TPA: hypothetical protein VE153_29610 [Myxococcus sp.]|nr:hypothetical protein [Myxococcus sp.]
MTRGILSRLASPLTRPAPALKASTALKAPAAAQAPGAGRVTRPAGHSSASGFTPSAAPKRLVLDVPAAPAAPALASIGAASFRVLQGVVPSKAAQVLSSVGRLEGRVGARDLEGLDGLRAKVLLGRGLGTAEQVQRLGGPGLPIYIPEQAAVNAAQAEYDEAVEARTAAEQRLASDLAAFGPALTEEERQRYIEAFWAQDGNKALNDAVIEAADNLSQVLEENGPRLEEIAANGHPQAQQQAALALQGAYESLATSETHADEAIAYAERVNKNPALAQALETTYGEDFEQRIGDEILAEAYPRAQAEIYSQHPDDPAAAAQALDALLSGFEAGQSLSGLAGDVQQLAEQVRALASGDYAAAEALIPGGDSPFAQALKLVGVAQGIYQGIHAPPGTPIDERLQSFLEAAQGGLEQASGLLQLFGRSGLAERAADLSTRLAPFLDLAIDATQLASDIRGLTEDGASPGEVIATVGSAIQVLGDVLWFTPAGRVLQLLGTVIHEVGNAVEAIFGDSPQEELREDRLELLRAAGVDRELRELLADNPELSRLLGTMGLDREQFIEELERADGILDGGLSDTATAAVWTAYQAAALYGLEGQEALDFIKLFEDLSPEDAHRLMFAGIAGLVASTDWSDPDADEVNGRLEEITAILTSILGEDVVAEYGLDDASVEDVNTDFLETSGRGR